MCFGFFFAVQKKYTDNSGDMNGTSQGEVQKTNSEYEQGSLVMMWRVCFLAVKGNVGQWVSYRNTRTKPTSFRNEGKTKVRK